MQGGSPQIIYELECLFSLFNILFKAFKEQKVLWRVKAVIIYSAFNMQCYCSFHAVSDNVILFLTKQQSQWIEVHWFYYNTKLAANKYVIK